MATNTSNLDVCVLIGGEEMLREVPDGVTSANGNCSGTDDTAHYIWTFDEGNVGSICVGADCITAGADGYQGVWP
jgi:hypothetical protein